MGRSVRVAAVAAAMLFSLPAAAFAETGTPASAVAAAVDCPAGPGPSGGTGSGEPPTGGDGGSEPDDKGSGSAPDDKGSGGAGPGGQGEGIAAQAAPGAPSAPGAPDASAAPAPPDQDDPGGDSGGGSGDPGSGGDGGSSGDDPGSGGDGGSSGDDQGSGGDQSSGDPGSGDDQGSGGDDGSDAKGSGGGSGDDGSGGEQPDGGDAGSGKAVDDPADCAPPAPAGPAPAEAPAAPAPAAPAAPPAPGAAAYPGAETSAASMLNWGEPNKVDDFDGELDGWNMYDGPGHAGEGRRSPEAISVKDGILTINGDAEGTTGGMAWTEGSQKYGRWEGRVRAPVSDPSYNALLLLWPTAENFPVGGEVDFMEMTDHTRQTTELFLHYGEDNSQVQGEVEIDGTKWHNWAVEWTPKGITAFVDGKEWWSTDDTSILPPGPMHLTVQLDWFPEGDGEVKPSKMEVDWVRQYPLPESEPGGGSGGNDEGLLDGLTGLPGRITEGSPDPGSAVRGPSGA